MCGVPHHFYVNLILLVVGEYLKSLLLQPTRGLDVLFHMSRILSTGLHALLAFALPFKNHLEMQNAWLKMVCHISKGGGGLAAELHFYNNQNVLSDHLLRAANYNIYQYSPCLVSL